MTRCRLLCIVALLLICLLTFSACDSTLTIIFDTQGGSAVDTIVVDEVNDYYAQDYPTKDGYEFGGWYSDIECTKEWSYSYDMRGTVTVYARWIETYFVVTWVNGDKVGTAAVYHGDTAVYNNGVTPTMEGYTFGGWTDENGDLFDLDTVITYNITLTAVWTAN